MKSTVKFLISLVCAVLTFSSLSVLADGQTDENYYGTPEEGMYVRQYQINKTTPLDGIHNWDFAEGFKYWAGLDGKKVADSAKLLTEDSVRYIKLTGDTQWNGIITPLTVVEELKPGQQACIVYDWKGNAADFQVYLSQWVQNESGALSEVRLGLMYGKTLHEAKDANDWNTSVTRTKELVKASDSGNENIYISAAMQLATEKPAEADARIANIRLCIMNVISGRIYDLDGKLIKSDTYEYKEDKKDYEQALEGFEDYYKRQEAEKLKQQAAAKKAQSSGKTTVSSESQVDSESSNNNSKTIILAVCISVTVLAIAAITVSVIIFKKPGKGNSGK